MVIRSQSYYLQCVFHGYLTATTVQGFVQAYLYRYHLWESVDISRNMKDARHMESKKLQFPTDSFSQQSNNQMIIRRSHVRLAKFRCLRTPPPIYPSKSRSLLTPHRNDVQTCSQHSPTFLHSSVLTISSDHSLFRSLFLLSNRTCC